MQDVQQVMREAGVQLSFSESEFLRPDFSAESFVASLTESGAMDLGTLAEELRRLNEALDESVMARIIDNMPTFAEFSKRLQATSSSLPKAAIQLKPIWRKALEFERVVSASERRRNELENELIDINKRTALLEKLQCYDETLRTAEQALGKQGSSIALQKSLTPEEEDDRMEGIERAARALGKLQEMRSGSTELKNAEIIQSYMGGSEADLRRELLRHLEVIFATEVLPRKEADANDDRHLLACLRSYAALGEARAAHSLFARLVISQILSNMLTPGQVDGATRGSFGGLPSILAAIIHQLKAKCMRVLDACRKLSIHIKGIDILCEACWAPIVGGLETSVKGLFSPGIAHLFHRNYSACANFLKQFLNEICNGQGERDRLLAHSATEHLQSRWSVPIYVGLRQQEFSEELAKHGRGSLLSSSSSSSSSKTSSSQKLHFDCLADVLTCASRCWDHDVLIARAAPDFLDLCLAQFDYGLKWAEAALDRLSSSTAARQGTSTEEQPKFTLKRIVDSIRHLSRDCGAISTAILLLYNDILNACNLKEDDDVRACLQQAAEQFSALSRRCWDSLAEKLQQACAEKLSGVKGIAAMYRFKKDVPLPTEASSYIVNVLQPLRTVVKDVPEGDAEHVSRTASSIVASCVAFYVKEAADILPAILKTEESLSKLKKFGKAASSTVCLDSTKIRAQLQLDINDFVHQAHHLGLPDGGGLSAEVEQLLSTMEDRVLS